jgi:DNA-binding NarL/FixJ family response regulator
MSVLDGSGARAPGREPYAERRWTDAYVALLEHQDELDGEGWVLLALSAYLLGRDQECTAHLEHAYRVLVDDGDVAWAARCAFWLSVLLLQRGEAGRGTGWMARGQQLVELHGLDGAERGYLQLPAALLWLNAGDGEAAQAGFARALEVALACGETDLLTLARLGTGQSLILQGRPREGMPLLDAAMVAVLADEVSPVVAGLVYCAVIEACQRTFELRRAQEWTEALTAWCDAQPDLVPYRGQCHVHRLEILRLHGDWREATVEAERARGWLSHPPGQPAVGAAIYQEAELFRLRGRFQQAEAAYAEASAHGHEPQPGLGRLRLAEGAVDAAVAGLRRALDEGAGPAMHPRLLSAYVEATLAAGDGAAAATAAEELLAMADRHDVDVVRALAAQALALVRLGADQPVSALRQARRAWTIWHGFGAPYEAARARVTMGLAGRALGDEDTARLELAAARRAFQQLGAQPDLAALETAAGRARPGPVGGLTGREVEVVLLVAAGRTNRSVAAELQLSEKTVARHLSNVYTKLGVSSRAAATAWAYEHDLT